MTREEEAIKWLKIFKGKTGMTELSQAFDVVIKALEQKPVLDKIKAEIKELSNANPSYWHSGDMVNRDDVLDIIDKYKEENEEMV